MFSLNSNANSVTGIEFATYSRLQDVGSTQWNELWSRTDSPTVFARYEWAQAWWEVFSESRALRIFTASSGGRLVALVATSWPVGGLDRGDTDIVVVGEDHADYAAFLVERQQSAVLAPLIDEICRHIPLHTRLVIRDVRSDTLIHTELITRSCALRSRWQLVGTIKCPRTLFSASPVASIVGRRSLRRSRDRLARLGRVQIHHLYAGSDIEPHLESFFYQHVDRWKNTPSPSLFLKDANRRFYRRLVEALSASGSIVFSVVELEQRPVAYHFGFVSEHDLIWYKPSYAPELARYSPGQTLIMELFRHAGAVGLRAVDFTRGNERFKDRFANDCRQATSFAYYSSATAAVYAKARSACVDSVRGLARRFRIRRADVDQAL